MNFERFKVTGLFGRFDHELNFRSDERIMIMIGPNGFGKTMTLRMIDNLFNQPLARLDRMPFRKMEVAFDDGSVIVAEKVLTGREPQEEDTEGLELTFRLHRGEREEFEQVFTVYGDELAVDFDDTRPKIPEWLQNIRQSIAVKFIDTERLTDSLRHRHRLVRSPRAGVRRRVRRSLPQRTVRLYSRELAERVQETLTEYGSLSQSLDRTFPSRFLAEPEGSDYSVDHFVNDLKEIEKNRSDLVEAGLIAQEEQPMEIPEAFGLDEPSLRVLAIYAQDAKQKLSVFDDLHKRVRAFRRIANSRFLYKRVMVGTDGLSVVDSDGLELDLEMLSSGEQHELIILYELLFRIPDHSLILIDEPELSLHVEWQVQFLKDIEEMATLSNFRVILATHSPEIIGDRWDLTAELKGSDDQ